MLDKIKCLEIINELLFKEWDPVGVSGDEYAEDEYSQYTDDIYQIILNSTSYSYLFEYLLKIEIEHMGLKGNKIKTEIFAKKLYEKIQKLNRSQCHNEMDKFI